MMVAVQGARGRELRPLLALYGWRIGAMLGAERQELHPVGVSPVLVRHLGQPVAGRLRVQLDVSSTAAAKTPCLKREGNKRK